GAGGVGETGPVTATTGAVPAAVRDLTLEVTGAPSPGYTLLVPVRFDSDTDNGFLLAFDSAGTLCWYREFDGLGWAVEAKQLETGNFSVYLGRSYGWAPAYGRYAEVTPEGVEVQDFRVDQPWFTDPHEMLLSGGGPAPGAVHLIGYGIRTVDLSAYGGPVAARLAMHFIERQGPTGAVEFLWQAADHYTPDDWPSPATQASLASDLVHPSSLAIDRDGNYVLSLQAMDEIAKIDAHTGAFVWRLGGRHNQFRFEQDPLAGFQGQHNVQVLEDGHLLLLDNRVRSEPAPARAAEYALDTGAMTATLVWEYQPNPAVISPIMGSVQRLASGHTVVGFGYAGRVDEADAGGAPVAQASLRDSGGASVQFYRALRIASLYRYQRP
ncbi:MAG TPA: arylsulfotransferase family protein, partial [Gemmatimonadales bacterium]|nr:arylsulfotransferase family protein [Gemmatimonadales bacterium]